MTQYIFDLPPVPAVKIQGEDSYFPVRRVFCVGRNYEAHAKEMGNEVDREEPWYMNYPVASYGVSSTAQSLFL